SRMARSRSRMAGRRCRMAGTPRSDPDSPPPRLDVKHLAPAFVVFAWRPPTASWAPCGRCLTRHRAILLARPPRRTHNHAMTPDWILGGVLFPDGSVRPVSRGGGGTRYVIDVGGHARCYGIWLRLEDTDVDLPLVVPASEAP